MKEVIEKIDFLIQEWSGDKSDYARGTINTLNFCKGLILKHESTPTPEVESLSKGTEGYGERI